MIKFKGDNSSPKPTKDVDENRFKTVADLAKSKRKSSKTMADQIARKSNKPENGNGK